MRDVELVEAWTQDSARLRAFVERALSDALTGTDHEWYLALRAGASASGYAVEKRFDRYVIYPVSQPWGEGWAERWRQRSRTPEGAFYLLDLSLECEHLILTHSNGSVRSPTSSVLQTSTTVCLYMLAGLSLNEAWRDLSERQCGFSSLEGIIRWMVRECAPNHVSAT